MLFFLFLLLFFSFFSSIASLLFLSSSPLFISSFVFLFLSGMSLSIYPLRSNFNTRWVPIYPLPDNIIFPCICMSRRCRYNPLPDNFDMRGGRYIYPLSTVITYTTGPPPSALSLDQNSRGHPNPREKTMLVSYPLPPRPYPTNSLEATQIYQVKRALSSRPPQTLEALSRPPQTLEKQRRGH